MVSAQLIVCCLKQSVAQAQGMTFGLINAVVLIKVNISNYLDKFDKL
jgi:hypothetical protein